MTTDGSLDKIIKHLRTIENEKKVQEYQKQHGTSNPNSSVAKMKVIWDLTRRIATNTVNTGERRTYVRAPPRARPVQYGVPVNRYRAYENSPRSIFRKIA